MISNRPKPQNNGRDQRWISRYTLSFLFIGLVLGYVIAILQIHIDGHEGIKNTDRISQSRVSSMEGSELTSVSDSKGQTPSITDAVVRVELKDSIDRSIHHALAIVTARNHTLVLPLPSIKDADEGSVINARGKHFILHDVIGENIGHGIVAVTSELSSGLSLQVSDETGALYLGREFIALAAGEDIGGWVDSLPFEKPNGAVTYLVRLQQAMEWQGGAMIDPQNRQLIGVAMTKTNDPTVYEVIDAMAVRELMDSIPNSTSLTLAEYSKYYYENIPSGMLERVQMLVNDEQWREAINLGRELLSQHPDLRDRVYPHLEKAYITLVRTAVDNNDYDGATALLDDAVQRLDESARRLLLRAEISEQRGNFQDARDQLHQAMDIDPAMKDTILPRIRRLVLAEINEQGQRLSTVDMISMLEDEINTDPDYAVYYNLLGRQYFNAGNYRAAVSKLEYAIRLNPELSQELGPSIATARQRINTPGLIEVPLYSSGDAYYVLAKLNGLPQSFRLLIDTGASFTAVSNEVAKELDILITENAGILTLNTANGIIQAPLRKLDSLSLDGAVVQNVDVVILETMDNFDGLIGQSYLHHFDIDINRSERKLILVRR